MQALVNTFCPPPPPHPPLPPPCQFKFLGLHRKSFEARKMRMKGNVFIKLSYDITMMTVRLRVYFLGAIQVSVGLRFWQLKLGMISTIWVLACLRLCLLVSHRFGYFWSGISVEVAVDRILRISTHPLPPPFFFVPIPTILSLTQMTVIWNQCAPVKTVSVPISTLYFVAGDLRGKCPGEHHVKLWDGTKLIRFAESASVRYCSLVYNVLGWPLSLWPRERGSRREQNYR